MFTLAFWKAAASRAVRTFAQAFLALIGTGAAGITSLDWRTDLSISATAALASVLMSLVSLTPILPPDNTAASPTPPATDPVTASVDFPTLPPAIVPEPAAQATVFPKAAVDAAVAAEPAPAPAGFEAPIAPATTPIA